MVANSIRFPPFRKTQRNESTPLQIPTNVMVSTMVQSVAEFRPSTVWELIYNLQGMTMRETIKKHDAPRNGKLTHGEEGNIDHPHMTYADHMLMLLLRVRHVELFFKGLPHGTHPETTTPGSSLLLTPSGNVGLILHFLMPFCHQLYAHRRVQ